MRKIIVLMSWLRLKLAGVGSFALNTVLKMTNNDYFEKPAVSLDDMTTAANRYISAFGNRLNGANARAEFKAAKTELFALLKKQSMYVNEQASGSELIITSAGFVASSGTSSKSVTPEQPKMPRASYQNGEVTLTVKTVKGASSYLWVVFFGATFPITITNHQLDIDQQARYILIPAGTSRECVRNVPIGVDINIQVLAQNSAGKSAFSATVFFHTGG